MSVEIKLKSDDIRIEIYEDRIKIAVPNLKVPTTDTMPVWSALTLNMKQLDMAVNFITDNVRLRHAESE